MNGERLDKSCLAPAHQYNHSPGHWLRVLLFGKRIAPRVFAILIGLLTALPGGSARAQLNADPPSGVPQQGLPVPLRDVGIEQRLNELVSLDLAFRDESGAEIKIGDYFGGKPVILALVYYECPMLCTQVLNGLEKSLSVLSFNVGDEFNVVTVSFNPRETPQLAAAKKDAYVKQYKRASAMRGWHFLTGDEKNVKALADSVGFTYAYDEKTGLYAHASGIMLLTPEGRISRYFYGIEYAPKDLRLGIIEASANKIGSPVDKLLLFCYHYDPATGKYSVAVLNLVRGAGIVMILAMLTLWLIAARKKRSPAPAAPWQLALLPMFPEQASSHAAKVDLLYFFLVGVAAFFTLLIFGLIIYFAVKYRRKSETEIGVPPAHAPRLEATWIVIPFILCMVIFVWGAKVFFDASAAPRESEEIYLVAKRWMWKVQHLDGHKEINELHVPVGRNIKMVMTTEDVIHSFFIPAFRIKADVVPGRYSTEWFKATKPGRYHLFCAEYCGTNHSGMGGWVEVMEPSDYEAWLGGGAAEGSLAASGEKLFTQLGCATCHKSDGTGRGPSLNGILGKPVKMATGETVIADDNYLRECVLKPKPVAGYPQIMPTFQGLVSEEQLLELVSYMKSLTKEPAPSTGVRQGPEAQPALPAATQSPRPAPTRAPAAPPMGTEQSGQPEKGGNR